MITWLKVSKCNVAKAKLANSNRQMYNILTNKTTKKKLALYLPFKRQHVNTEEKCCTLSEMKKNAR